MPDFHDHGSWVGPCSEQKHAAIRGGTLPMKVKPEAPMAALFEHLRLALEMTVQTDSGVLCACCRHNYTER